tara:strand:- start:434 stop:1060 length:627 start_codon:yes stop_codon:yes gene_type:complete
MGKSDPHVFDFYSRFLPNKKYEKVALLGNQKDNAFTAAIQCQEKDFYDLALKNWNINDDDWKISKKYDLVLSTRCPYFAKDPKSFIEKCLDLLNPGGTLFLDWGLGDHWRFEEYKVGWVKNEEQEFAYADSNFLWSTVWHDSFLNHPHYLAFQENVKKFGYENVKDAIRDEVPAILDLSEIKNVNIQAGLMTLWEDKPQLYIGLLLEK